MLSGVRKLHAIALSLACSLSIVAGVHAQAYTDESPDKRNARMAWWREARFGMFIHWGVYSVPAGTYEGVQHKRIGEWLMHEAKIPVAEYRKYADKFNPVKYDPEVWAQLAADAGMKYIVITAKHHDGFALYPSAVTDWDIADATPYGADLIGPLAAAARKRGLRFGAYYSHAQDWVHPGGAKARCGRDGWDPEHIGDFDKYLAAIAIPQVAEILFRYDPDVLWWDTPSGMNEKHAARFLPLLRTHPELIVNDRLCRPLPKGDFVTPEQSIPEASLCSDWEACMTMNRTWGYKDFDHEWKDSARLIRNLIETVSKGGNYLLNVGPKSDGTIPDESIERLREIGRWMKANGESIYKTTAGPTSAPRWGRITMRRDGASTTLYLHVYNWPRNGEIPVDVANDVEECYLLADPARTFDVTRHDEHTLAVRLTGKPSDPVASVVVLRVLGEPINWVGVVRQADNDDILLTAEDAEIVASHGSRAKLESRGGSPNIGHWTDAATWLRFRVGIERAGEFDVVFRTASRRESKLELRAGDQSLTATLPPTEGWDQFENVPAGRIKLAPAGLHHLNVIPVHQHWRPVNLQSVRLVPVE